MLMRVYYKLSAAWKIQRDPLAYARSIGVRIGDGCRFVALTPGTFGSEPYLVEIGNQVTVAAGVRFITHDGGVAVVRDKDPEVDIVAPIRVGNNVFVGTNALLMPGVTIGDNCVIGAGSVVTRDIPSGNVAVGVPARCLKTVDEYRRKVLDNAFHVRSKSDLEKRKLWEEHFFGADNRSLGLGLPRLSPTKPHSTDRRTTDAATVAP